MPSPSIGPNSFLPGLHIQFWFCTNNFRLNKKWLFKHQFLHFDPRPKSFIQVRNKCDPIQIDEMLLLKKFEPNLFCWLAGST